MKALHVPGRCQRLGCQKTDSLKIRVDGELFAADPERGVEAGYRLYGVGCCGGAIMRTGDLLAGEA